MIIIHTAVLLTALLILYRTAMVSSLATIRSSNAGHPLPPSPVAIFVGGTSGIGRSMAEAFARYTNGSAHIVLIGRNRAAAESILASLPKSTAPDTPFTHEFLQCDVTLMKNVNTLTQQLLQRYPTINFLVMSPGFLSMKDRDETPEGIDRRLAASYYARWKFARDLLPSLQKAKDAGQEAKVVSILTPGRGTAIDTEDLGLKKSFSAMAASGAASTYNDLMMEVWCFFLPVCGHTLTADLGVCVEESPYTVHPRVPRHCAHGFGVQRRFCFTAHCVEGYDVLALPVNCILQGLCGIHVAWRVQQHGG